MYLVITFKSKIFQTGRLVFFIIEENNSKPQSQGVIRFSQEYQRIGLLFHYPGARFIRDSEPKPNVQRLINLTYKTTYNIEYHFVT